MSARVDATLTSRTDVRGTTVMANHIRAARRHSAGRRWDQGLEADRKVPHSPRLRSRKLTRLRLPGDDGTGALYERR